MVTSRLSALDRKLLRDLWQMRGQALAIATVIAAGVTMFVMYLSNFESLRRTVDTYYRQQRFADVFATLVRAPEPVAARIAALPGVDRVETRVVAEVTLEVPGMTEPAAARLVSVPDRGRPVLNDVFLRSGRWMAAGADDEVLAGEAFCEAHGMGPGDRVAVVLNGRWRRLTIVGVALSPEYVYSIRPGEILPDARRYGVFWMNHGALAAAMDMEGGFDELSLTLARGADEDAVIAAVDRLLEPYGGLGAIPRRLQVSAWTLDNELAQLTSFGTITPVMFLIVAGFILHVALTRALALQRPQIATLKAVGYSNGQVRWHYVKWALTIALVGAAAGIACGTWLGESMIGLYVQYFKFPMLDYRLSAGLALAAAASSLVTAALGAAAAVRRAVAIPPAEAMRPEPPARYRRSLVEGRWLRGAPQGVRMVLRNLERQPGRAGASVAGIAMAGAVLYVGFGFIDAMDVLIDQQFVRSMRQDATLALVEPRGASAMHALERLPGVIRVEPMRTVPVRLRAGVRHRTLAITGLVSAPTLARVVDRAGTPARLPEAGLVLSAMLARTLQLQPGDVVRAEVLEGARPALALSVAALVDDSVGLQAYMEIGALRRALREGATVTGASLMVDAAASDAFYAEVKGLPSVAGVALRRTILAAFRETMAEHINLIVFVNVIFAGIIAFGVVYNAARVSLSERERELASLRVLGFTRAEISAILLGELAIITLASLPVGVVMGEALGRVIAQLFNNEVYRIPFVISRQLVAWTLITVVVAAVASGLVVRRRLDRLDLVAVLKARE